MIRPTYVERHRQSDSTLFFRKMNLLSTKTQQRLKVQLLQKILPSGHSMKIQLYPIQVIKL